MSRQTSKCTNQNGRHSWRHLRNTITTSIGPQRVKVSSRGVYACGCGATKIGASHVTPAEA